MDKQYIAHKDKHGNTQSLKKHSENVAKMCREYAISVLEDLAYIIGLLHDVGKYQESFQKRIKEEAGKIEHAFCGAQVISELLQNFIGHIAAFCISGHHTGLPDGGVIADRGNPNKSTLYSKLGREGEDYSDYKKELDIIDLDIKEIADFMCEDCDNDISKLVDKTSFIVRFLYSCLVDADSNDAADFNDETERKLFFDFNECLEIINKKISSFVHITRLQKARHVIAQQVYEKIDEDADFYLLNSPTGSGKTLCSLKFAFERIIKRGYKRIIYVCSYNSIIDQTATECQKMFGEKMEILQHCSTVCYGDNPNDGGFSKAAESAIENWEAPFIVTTAVQFFETLYGNKRRQLRKMHNLKDSFIIIDEAHLLPKDYLQPCVQGLAYIAKYLNSEVLLATATMPDFEKTIKEMAFQNINILDLVQNKKPFDAFKKCRIKYIGAKKVDDIVALASSSPSSLIIVNSRRTARLVYNKCKGVKIHLSTYMTPKDRKREITRIKTMLAELEKDFPDGNVPEDRKIVVVSTSLIEAGVDLDMHTVLRELAGLHNILQSAGRQNREGKRPISEMYVFEFSDVNAKAYDSEEKNITRKMLQEYEDVSYPEVIDEYYKKMYELQKSDYQKNTMSRLTNSLTSIPFKSYAEQFEMIESIQVSVVVPIEHRVYELLDICEQGKPRDVYKSVRKLQEYTCSIYPKELDMLLEQGVIKVSNLGIYCLTNPVDYYDENVGILTNPKTK